MAIPHNADSVPTYMVYRDTPADEPFDPTSPLLFFPPKGSDELFDALRIAFPHVKTHSERMRDAMIQYLLQERQDEQLASPAATMDTMPTTTWPAMSSDSNSTWSSPELLNFPTPEASFSNSPQLDPQLSRQTSIATSSRASPTGPSIDQMTNVFCLSTSSQPRQRVRRKMTDAEKAEYRKRRIVKACDKCAKRKRKCPHNQAEMAQVPNKSNSRTAKPPSKPTIPTNSTQSQSLSFDSSMNLDELAKTFDPSEFIAFNDFNMFDESYPELDMNDMIDWNQNELLTPDVSPLQRDWSYGSQTDDFTLLDPRASHQVQFNDMSFTPGQTHGDTLYDHNSRGEQQPFDNLQTFAHVQDVHALAKVGGLDRQGDGQDGQRLQNSGGTNGGSGNKMLWEHLRTGQSEPRPEKPVPTHTAHVHAAESIGLHSLDEQIARPLETTQRTLPQTVMRLTGTTKAVTVMLRNIGNRSQECSSVTMDSVVHALCDRDLLADANQQQRRSRNTSSVPAHIQRAVFQSSPLHSVVERATSRPDEVNLTSSDLPQGKSGSRRIVRSLLGESSTPLMSTSVSVSRASPTRTAAAPQGWPQQLQQQPSAEQDGTQTQARSSLPRQQPSLGEGIPVDVSAASDLYMARRRISSRLHRHTDVNTSGSGSAGIRGTDELHISRASKTSVPTAESVSRDLTAMRTTKSAPLGQDKSNTDVRTSRSTPTPQPNGGAYLQAGQQKKSPVHTRPRNPTAPGSSADTDQHHGAGSTNLATVSHPASSLAQAVASGLQAHEARLSCHNAYRDHHGRSAVSWIAVLGVLFMLTMALSAVGIVPSVAILALVYPLSGQEVQEVTTSRQQTFVRCSTKNSSWLSTYASMQLASSKSSSRGRGNEKDGGLSKAQLHPAWPKGLMYPSANAVLQSVAGA